MVAIVVTPLDAAGVEVLPPDIVWEGGTVGDFALSTASDNTAGGLQSIHPIMTAVIMCLFTDVRVAARELRFEHGGDRRGWPGDGFDMGAQPPRQPLGSKLWLMRRMALTELTEALIDAEARRALQSLIDEGLAVRIDTRSEIARALGQVRLGIDLYGRDGRKVYAARFDPLWRTTTPF